MTAAASEPGAGAGRPALRAAIARSRFLGAVRAFHRRCRRLELQQSSTAWRLRRRAGEVAATAAEASVVGRLGRTLWRWTRRSAGYRWLTREPEPDVLVIDLRETVTVGPVVERLDRLSEALRPALRESKLSGGIAALGTRVGTHRVVLEDSRAVRLLAAVLEPPEPPGESARSTEETERRGDPDGERPATDERRAADGRRPT